MAKELGEDALLFETVVYTCALEGCGARGEAERVGSLHMQRFMHEQGIRSLPEGWLTVSAIPFCGPRHAAEYLVAYVGSHGGPQGRILWEEC
jgi:hypothetical protein